MGRGLEGAGVSEVGPGSELEGPEAGQLGQFLKGQVSEPSLWAACCPGGPWGASCWAGVAPGSRVCCRPASLPLPSHAGPPSWLLLLPGPAPLLAPELLVRVRSVDPAPCWAAFQSWEECPFAWEGSLGPPQPRA